MCYLQSSILFLLPHNLSHSHLFGDRMGLKPRAEDKRPPHSLPPRFWSPYPAPLERTIYWPITEHGIPALNRHAHTSGCPCQNRSAAPWWILRRLCSQSRILADGTNANWTILAPPSLCLLSYKIFQGIIWMWLVKKTNAKSCL